MNIIPIITLIKNNLTFLLNNLNSIMILNLPSLIFSNKIIIFIISLVLVKIEEKINVKPNSLFINLDNIPIDMPPTPSEKLSLYLSLVKLIKNNCNINSLPLIVDYKGRLNYIDNASNVQINKNITLNSTFIYNDDNTFNCSLTLFSKSYHKLKKFINKAKPTNEHIFDSWK
jgi:hypothetical protein